MMTSQTLSSYYRCQSTEKQARPNQQSKNSRNTMEKASFEKRLRSILTEYLSRTNTRTMTPVRKHILQIMIFLYGQENCGDAGVFSYSKNKEVADQQRKYILYAYLFLEDLKKNAITERDLTTLQKLWGQHILSLVKNGKENNAEKYEQILHDSKEMIFNIKRFQRYLERTADNKTERVARITGPFSFRRPRITERLAMKLRAVFGQGDTKDFFMIKFQDIQ